MSVEEFLEGHAPGRCFGSEETIWVTIGSNGVRSYFYRCSRCRGSHNGRASATPATRVEAEMWARDRGISATDLPIYADNRDASRTCAVRGCHSHDVEWHHWAPRHIFGSWSVADLWPGSYLCRDHHQEWHRRVTPNMSAKRSA